MVNKKGIIGGLLMIISAIMEILVLNGNLPLTDYFLDILNQDIEHIFYFTLLSLDFITLIGGTLIIFGSVHVSQSKPKVRKYSSDLGIAIGFIGLFISFVIRITLYTSAMTLVLEPFNILDLILLANVIGHGLYGLLGIILVKLN